MAALNELQQRIADKRAERGFVTDPIKIHLLLTEEVGEVASELKRTWSKNYDSFNKDRLADELADTFVLLSALATAFDIDLVQAVETKFFGKDAAREWKTAQEEG
jgi:NTP pyrophosphatase (non-canonical NTP hydrolase)